MPSFHMDLEGIELKANKDGVFDVILSYKVPAGGLVIFPVVTRAVMKLYDTSGKELDKKTEMYFAFKTPAARTWVPLTEVFNYRKFYALSEDQQRDSRKTPTIEFSKQAYEMLEPDEEGLAFGEDMIISLHIKTPEGVVWDKDNDDNVLELLDVEVSG